MTTKEQYEHVAAQLQVPVAAVKAVTEVESNGVGLLMSKEPKILFEAHHFSRLTNHVYDSQYPDISTKSWDKTLYVGGQGEHKRLQAAAKLDRDAALQSASWGMFQVMGFHWKALGYSDLQEFVNDMYSEEGQLKAFVKFIKANSGMWKALQRLDWATFARRYNGPGYAANRYDTKLASAFKKHST